MTTTVRIVITFGDQVQVYVPSSAELHGFVPTGQLVAQLRKCPEGYRVYHAATETTDLHQEQGQAVIAALHLTTDTPTADQC